MTYRVIPYQESWRIDIDAVACVHRLADFLESADPKIIVTQTACFRRMKQSYLLIKLDNVNATEERIKSRIGSLIEKYIKQ